MTNDLGRTRIEIACPSCGYKNSKSIAWLKAHKQFRCGGCRQVRIETSKFARGMRQVESEIGKLAKSFGRSGRIKF